LVRAFSPREPGANLVEQAFTSLTAKKPNCYIAGVVPRDFEEYDAA